MEEIINRLPSFVNVSFILNVGGGGRKHDEPSGHIYVGPSLASLF